MAILRPFRRGDEAGLVDVCLRTGDIGADATGILDDDRIWAEIFALPYAARHPEFAFVIEADDARVVGYVVATPDTDAFETWFAETWWPARSDSWPDTAMTPERQRDLLAYAAGRRAGASPYAAEYPAHLHIDLLPEAQGQGWGRRLIDAELDALRAAGVTGVHLVASAANTGAVAFYRRLGFTPLPADPADAAFARAL
jgi:ribosomal protein S18 acetylase RimI-like enzyme